MSSLDLVSLKADITARVAPKSAAIRRIRQRRSAAERADAYADLISEVVSGMNVCWLDGGVFSWFDGRGYVPVGRDVFVTLFLEVMRENGGTATDMNGVRKYVLDGIATRRVESDRGHLCFTNGVLDLETGVLMPFSYEFASAVRMEFPFFPDAVCPTWDAFLKDVLPDEGVRMNLQEFFGMTLIDRTKVSIEKFAVLVGSGSNGKSVVLGVITAVLGASRVSNLTPKQLCDDKAVVGAYGKMLNVGNDLRSSSEFDSALKPIISGQTVQAWMLYKGYLTMRCPPLVFALNEMPVFRDRTEGFFRRLMVFRFGKVISQERQDRTLAARIIASELPGVFLWMLKGRDRLIASGGRFTPSAEMDRVYRDVRTKVMSRQYPVHVWLERNRLSVTPTCEGQMAERYTVSRIVESMGRSVTAGAVTKELEEMGATGHRNDEQVFNLYRYE